MEFTFRWLPTEPASCLRSQQIVRVQTIEQQCRSSLAGWQPSTEVETTQIARQSGKCIPPMLATRVSAPPVLPLLSPQQWRRVFREPRARMDSLPSLREVSANRTCSTVPSTRTSWPAVTEEGRIVILSGCKVETWRQQGTGLMWTGRRSLRWRRTRACRRVTPAEATLECAAILNNDSQQSWVERCTLGIPTQRRILRTSCWTGTQLSPPSRSLPTSSTTPRGFSSRRSANTGGWGKIETISGNQSLASDLPTTPWSLLVTVLIIILASDTGKSRTRGVSYGVNQASCGYRGVTDFAGSELTYPLPSVVPPHQGRRHLLQI